MSIRDFENWMTEQSKIGNRWYAKRLSGNDTLANGSHQAGPYFPKSVIFELFPSLKSDDTINPRVNLIIHENPSARKAKASAIWYNNKTRNEARITGFGGKESVVLDPESTGAIAVFSFSNKNEVNVWVCKDHLEEEVFETFVGTIEPGEWYLWSPEKGVLQSSRSKMRSCQFLTKEIRPEWYSEFPIGAFLVDESLRRRPLMDRSLDEKILERRKCEFELFMSIEEAVEITQIRNGFISVDAFIQKALSVLNRRKSRSGKSLELHLKAIFTEIGMIEGVNFAHDEISEGKKRPDFLFPNGASYQDKSFPSEKLIMLAVKTTCKDRWRQILNEAKRIKTKYLFTLQEGVSLNQYQEMKDSGVKLVVPQKLHRSFNDEVQKELLTLENFVAKING